MSTTKLCPKCGATAVHKDRQMHDVNHATLHHGGHQLHGAMSGNPAGLIVVGGLWAVSKLIHCVSHTWKCGNTRCGHEFS